MTTARISLRLTSNIKQQGAVKKQPNKNPGLTFFVSPGVFCGKQYKNFRFCGKLIVFGYGKAKVWRFTPLMLKTF